MDELKNQFSKPKEQNFDNLDTIKGNIVFIMTSMKKYYRFREPESTRLKRKTSGFTPDSSTRNSVGCFGGKLDGLDTSNFACKLQLKQRHLSDSDLSRPYPQRSFSTSIY